MNLRFEWKKYIMFLINICFSPVVSIFVEQLTQDFLFQEMTDFVKKKMGGFIQVVVSPGISDNASEAIHANGNASKDHAQSSEATSSHGGRNASVTVRQSRTATVRFS